MFRETRQKISDSAEDPMDAYYERIPDAIACTDVKQLDFGNSTFNAGGTLFSFQGGVAEQYDSDGWAIAVDAGSAPKPEFRYEIMFDKSVAPEAGITVRFLGVGWEHLTGSGQGSLVFGFTCTRGRLREVFRRDALSLSVESLTDAAITLSTLPFGGRNTSKWSRYKWSGAQQRYARDRVWFTPRRLCKSSTLMSNQCDQAKQ